MAHRDLIVVGASSGGLETLSRLLPQFPADLPAAILVVLHTAPHRISHLARTLGRRSSLPVHHGQDGDRFVAGHVFVAPPDEHMVVTDGHLRVGRGPRENHTRPAIDPLFRSAAVAGRESTVGVLLSGLLDDGAAGLQAIRRCGGVTIVQNPTDALYAEMPRHALQAGTVDHVVDVAEMGPLIEELLRTPPPAPPAVPTDLELEVRLTERSLEGGPTQESRPDAEIRILDGLGELIAMACPECGGTLWQMRGEPRYRCHVGHGYSATSLLSTQDMELERALWGAVRCLEERAKVLETLAGGEAGLVRGGVSQSYSERGSEARQYADQIRAMLASRARGGLSQKEARNEDDDET